MSIPRSERFRPSAKAVVVRHGLLLTTRNRTPGDHRPDWYILPGGGQIPGETLDVALVREVREETGIEIVPGPLVWVRELIVALRADWPFDPGDHALEFMFAAEFVADHGDPSEADLYQQSVEWISPETLSTLRFYPATLVPALQSYLRGGPPGPVYLGDVD
ncbi:MAG: NUDIX domain-containing protein [Acidimicrobiia bacterium]|nr:NUDIX domain-containing protein [Acidimicrobiia bacterium]